MELLDPGDVDQLNVVANLDADGVECLRDDFVWALVLWMERRFDGIYPNIHQAEVWNMRRWRRNNLRVHGEAGLQLAEGVEEVLAVVLQGVYDGAWERTARAVHHLSRREVVIFPWSVAES